MAGKRERYTRAPEVPAEEQRRYEAVRKVLAGEWSVAQAARELGLARNHFQNLLNRAMAGMLEGLRPKPPGPKAPSGQEASLRVENRRLRRHNEQLVRQVETDRRLLTAVSEILQRQVGATATGRAPRRARVTPPAAETGTDEEAGGRLDRARRLLALGASPFLAAAAAQVSRPTLRRWRARQRQGAAPRLPRPRPAAKRLTPQVVAQVESRIRELHGLVGTESLHRAVEGVSRRQAAAIKRSTLTEMERERVAQAVRVEVLRPGIVRGYDEMHVPTTEGPYQLLVSADGHVPFRTSLELAERCTGATVARALERDLALNGAPLVWRVDRARTHETAPVKEVLHAHRVLLLHGPPRLARYYGQLERQNREHRAWLRSLGVLSPARLEEACGRMRHALNERWPRRTLGWRTAADVWNERTPLTIDRDALQAEVEDRAERLRRTATVSDHIDPERLAIELTLHKRGLLTLRKGGWC